MARLTKVAGLLLAIMLAALLTGCGGGDATPPQNRRFGALEFNLTTPKTTYMRGEQVPLTFTVKNVGSQTINVTRAACEFFDTKVTSGSTVVWQTSQTHGCAGVLIDISIAPGETKTYSYIWPQTDLQGDQVPAGSYTLSSWYQPYNRSDETLLPRNQETNEAAFPVQIVVQ